MPMRGSASQIKEMRRRVVLLGQVCRASAPLVAEEAVAITRQNVAGGLDPDGNAHPATKDGRRPLVMLAGKVTGGATGDGFEVRVGGAGGFHQAGAGHHRIIRRVVPGEGEDIPMAWTGRMARIYERKFIAAKGGA